MTSSLLAPGRPSGAVTSADAPPSRVAALVVLVCVGLWWWPIALAFGGRDPGATTAGIALLIPALVVVRADRLPVAHFAALAPGFIAAAAVLWSPTSGDGLDEAATCMAGGLIYLVAAAWRMRGGSPWVLLGPIALGAAIQVWIGWWIWFGQGGPSQAMVGTFYWHNPFGAFVLAVAVTAAALFVHGVEFRRGVTTAAVLTAAFAGAATFFSGSRACVALLVVSGVVLASTCLRTPRRLARLGVILAGIAALGAVLTWALPSAGSATDALNARGESAVGNAGARLDYVQAAWSIIRRVPWTGSGADSFGAAGPTLVGDFRAPTQWVHNGYLQAFVDGGLLMGAAVVLCVVAVLVIGLHAMFVGSRLFRSDQCVDAVRGSALLGFAVLAGHAGFDFDWAYPVLVALLAVLAAIVVVPSPARDSQGPPTVDALATGPRMRQIATTSVLAVAVIIGLAASAGVDAAAPTGGQVPLWRTVLTGGLAGDSLPGPLRAASECRRAADQLIQPGATVIPGDIGGPLIDCLRPTIPLDPGAQTVVERLQGRPADDGR